MFSFSPSARSPLSGLGMQVAAVLAMGFLLPFLLYPVARMIGRLARADAASFSAHYGSVSVATFAVGVTFLAERRVDYNSQLPLFLVLLEVPAIVVGIFLARRLQAGGGWGRLMHEIFLGKSIVLLVGGLAIGWIAGPEGVAPLEPLFFDLFKGVLALFLLEMGLIAASQFRSVQQHGWFLLAFGTLYTITNARGSGSRGIRDAGWSSSGNVRIEVVCSEDIAEKVESKLHADYYDHYAMILFESDVKVLRDDKFD